MQNKYFRSGELEEIEAAIRKAEQNTSGEIVVMLVNSAKKYKKVTFFVSCFFGISLTVLGMKTVPFLLPDDFLMTLIKLPFSVKDEFIYIFTYGIGFFLIVSFLLISLFFQLFSCFKGWLRLLIPEEIMEENVRKRAFLEFYRKGIYLTKEGTGVLVLITRLERKVYILADRGIYQKITQEGLDRFALEISKGIKTHDEKNALIKAISGIGKHLSDYFPAQEINENELADRVIVE